MAISNIIPATTGEYCLSMNYDATGLASVTVFANTIIGWGVDIADLEHPQPVILGALPPAPPVTDPVLSPNWAVLHAVDQLVMIPDVWRGPLIDFFEWLESNNGANRQVSDATKVPMIADTFAKYQQRA